MKTLESSFSPEGLKLNPSPDLNFDLGRERENDILKKVAPWRIEHKSSPKIKFRLQWDTERMFLEILLPLRIAKYEKMFFDRQNQQKKLDIRTKGWGSEGYAGKDCEDPFDPNWTCSDADIVDFACNLNNNKKVFCNDDEPWRVTTEDPKGNLPSLLLP